ncbi:hypothetical protein [Ochrobactrum sp. 19YEA23]|uniref:hypothetical protein n=1 Tax=Ochrobactrum sp. 19YEA23 TaxID=3039854 RepID=UPI0024790F96
MRHQTVDRIFKLVAHDNVQRCMPTLHRRSHPRALGFAFGKAAKLVGHAVGVAFRAKAVAIICDALECIIDLVFCQALTRRLVGRIEASSVRSVFFCHGKTSDQTGNGGLERFAISGPVIKG